MGKRFTGVLISICIVCGIFAAVSCSGKKENTDVAALTKDNISGESLWERISSESSYTSYAFWPGHEGLQPGQAPHGPFHKVYINHALSSALPLTEAVALNGQELESILVALNTLVAESDNGKGLVAPERLKTPNVQLMF